MSGLNETASDSERVSVIIPTFNCARWITESIESVLHQTYGNHEILIVDDGSTDHTKTVIDRYTGHDRIEYFYQENQGAASARNTGIEHATGTYLAFLDADDVWLPEKTERQLSVIREHPDVALVTSNALLIDQKGRITGKNQNTFPDDPDQLLHELFLNNIVKSTPSILVKRSAAEAIGGFDESLPHREDHFFMMRIADQFGIQHCRDFLVKIRDRPGSMSSELDVERPAVKIDRLLSLKKPFIRRAITEFPFLKDRKTELLSRYFKHGSLLAYKVGNRRQALRYIKRAIAYHPRKLKYYLLLVLFMSPISYKYACVIDRVFSGE